MKKILIIYILTILSFSLAASKAESKTLNMVLNPAIATLYEVKFVSDNQNKSGVNEYRFSTDKDQKGNVFSKVDNSFQTLYAYYNILSTTSFTIKLELTGPLKGKADNSDEIDVSVSWDPVNSNKVTIASHGSNKSAILLSRNVSNNQVIQETGFEILTIKLNDPTDGYLGYTPDNYNTTLKLIVEGE